MSACAAIGEGPCRTYLLASAKSRQALLVDPLLQKVESDLALLKSEGLSLAGVVDTHTHADHLSAAAVLSEKTGAPYLMHKSSRSRLVTRPVEDGETLGLGELRVTFLHTPGHTRDSLTLLLDDRVLSGDFLFLGEDGAGRLDLPGADPAQHYESLKKLEALADGLFLSPAHEYRGGCDSTLGAQRKANPVLTPRGRDAYLDWWSGRKGGDAAWMEKVVAANVAGARDFSGVSIPAAAAACACAAPADAAELPAISAADLERKLRLAPRSLVLLDVRTHEEYNDELGHLRGSVLVPVDELGARASEVPAGPVAVICRSGKRAARAASVLRAAGRSELWVLTGGMLAWNEAGLPVERR